MNRTRRLRSLDPVRQDELDTVLGAIDKRLAQLPEVPLGTAAAGVTVVLGTAPAVYRRRRLGFGALAAVAVAAALVVVALSTVGTSDWPKGSFATPWRPGRPASSPAAAPAPGQANVSAFRLVSYIAGQQWETAPGPLGETLDCPTVSACYMTAESGPGAVYFSADGGRTWSSLTLPRGFRFSTGIPLSCGGPSTCAGAGMIAGKAAVISTTDGGHRWAVVPWPGPGQLVSLTCAPGGVCAGTSTLPPRQPVRYFGPLHNEAPPPEVSVRTTNGGKTWSVSPLPASVLVSALECPSANRCTAVGELVSTLYSSVPSEAAVFSSDGGKNWGAARLVGPMAQGLPEALSCPTAEDCIAVSELSTISFVIRGSHCPPGDQLGGESNGLNQCTAALAPNLLRTTDGGKIWHVVRFSERNWGGYQLPAGTSSGYGPVFSCPSAENCWLTNPFFVEATSNGGRTWVPQDLPGRRSIGAISCPQVGQCVAIGFIPTAARSVAIFSSIAPASG